MAAAAAVGISRTSAAGAGSSNINSSEFRFFLSCDISLPLTFRVLQAPIPPPAQDGLDKKVSELFVECKLYIDGIQFGLPVNTRCSALPRLSIRSVWDVSSGEGKSVVGGATIFLFNSKKQLKTGKQKLQLWPQKEADGRVPTTTPGKVPKNERGEIERLERLVNKYERGQIQHVDWLDRLAFSAIDKVKEKECERLENSFSSLVVEFCSFEHRVVFQESGANFYAPTPVSLSNELVTKQLVWKFRFSLMSEKKALTKFLRSVDWSDIQEAKQAVELMGKWETIDVADALELLSSDFNSEEVRAYAVSVLERADDEELQCYLLQLVQALRFERSDKSRLAHFLVNRALSNIEIASFLRWYVVVELHDHAYAKRYYNTMTYGFRLWQSLSRQTELTAQLCSIMKDVRNTPIRSPLAPTLLLTGVVPQESSIFKSSLIPLRLTFKTANGGTSKMIFKKGDDLRQDQLVIQMVSLMDRLLKLENMDLHLTPYQVLATGQDEGMVEFIPSSPLAQIISEHRSITSYLQKFHPDEDGPFGITAQCLETFIKSCAGYSVITYIMGVGDRHLDNLLIRDDGCLFHVDFGFILGRDPKPFPPPMKLCKEMVEAMGGTESQYYTRFKSYCCEAYNILRNNSSLILNLFTLMERSSIPDISTDENATLKVQEKFRLDLDDEEAIHFFQGLINDSVSALFPQMVETIHRWAQYWR
ncbi:hypothetical protein ZWY2020_029657 [Hordeum vulgare]|nr:hypothetical protein ZWY2020_029657 [Hordeum vulgare]